MNERHQIHASFILMSVGEQQTSPSLRLLDRWKVKSVLLLMWIVTVLTPLAILPSEISGSDMYGWHVRVVYYFLFGAYFQPSIYSEPSGWISGPSYLGAIVLLLPFFIIYAILVTLYCMKPRTQLWAIVSGVLSFVIPGIFAGFSFLATGVYLGSLPFQFILGLVVMRLAKPGKEKTPFGLIKKKSSWWDKESE